MKKRQKLRLGIILFSFFLFPATFYYLSPVLIVQAASQGIVNGSFIVFGLQFAAALLLGRAFCGWVWFAAYRRGVDHLVKQVKAAGAKLILMTPPAFDPLPLKQKGSLRAAGAEKYAYFAIYEDYDSVLKRYAQWIMQQRERVDLVVDLHTPVLDYVAQ